MPDSAARAVVSDDGSTISLTVYTAAGDAVAVALFPVRAVALAGELIQAAVPKLHVTAKSAVTYRAVENKPATRRGGDPRAEQRRRRDEAVCALRELTGKDKPLEPWARETAQKLTRFRPLPKETIPERCLLQEIKATGLPIGPKRIKEIVAKQ